MINACKKAKKLTYKENEQSQKNYNKSYYFHKRLRCAVACLVPHTSATTMSVTIEHVQ